MSVELTYFLFGFASAFSLIGILTVMCFIKNSIF